VDKLCAKYRRIAIIALNSLFHMDFQLHPRGRAAGHKFFTATGAMGEFGNAAQSCRNAGRAKRVS
jgi:hypothetical protein